MLSTKEKQDLKAQAHSLKPVVMIGAKGLTDAVIIEVTHALEAHELIKVKIALGDKAHRNETAEVLSDVTEAELVTVIGQIAILYKKRPEKN